MQMGELSFDFAEGLVVGLGIQGEEKRTLGAKWQEFTKGAITFTVSPNARSTGYGRCCTMGCARLGLRLYPIQGAPPLAERGDHSLCGGPIRPLSARSACIGYLSSGNRAIGCAPL